MVYVMPRGTQHYCEHIYVVQIVLDLRVSEKIVSHMDDVKGVVKVMIRYALIASLNIGEKVSELLEIYFELLNESQPLEHLNHALNKLAAVIVKVFHAKVL